MKKLRLAIGWYLMGIASMLLFITVAFTGCDIERKEPQFKKGEYAIIRLDRRKCAIINTYCNPSVCQYGVRVAQIENYTQMLGGEISSKAYSKEYLNEWELEKIK